MTLLKAGRTLSHMSQDLLVAPALMFTWFIVVRAVVAYLARPGRAHDTPCVQGPARR